ncbi:VOC family protein [Leucobacter weissii]|uniref:VOC family protein n=1 Tax=Leucobacter weissii TaxID=1983706 RepID=A0A939MKZ1_9MICO|nr:VOC family protein [Leucobacter weissii]MBO1902678.1 VOC family protein [Leucobacter weissii]
MHIDHVGLSVGDLDAQLAWYRHAFGFPLAKPFEVAELGLRGAFLLGPDGVAVEFLERAGSAHRAPARSAPDELLAQGWGHLCFRVDDIEAVFAALVAAGAGVVSPPSPSPEPGVRFAYVTDPEGNFIELVDRDRAVGG